MESSLLLKNFSSLYDESDSDHRIDVQTMYIYHNSRLQYHVGDTGTTRGHKRKDIQHVQKHNKILKSSTLPLHSCNSNQISSGLSLDSLCRYNSDVITSGVFPFLEFKYHINFGCVSTVLLQASGLKLPPYTGPHSMMVYVPKPGAWKKSIKLPITTSDTQLKQFCNYAKGTDKLDISWCINLKNIFPVSKLCTLQSLNLSWCSKLEDISALGELTTLKHLRLDYCSQLKKISPLGNIPSLRTLNLDGCVMLNDISILGKLSYLQSLSLSGCELEGDISVLGDISTLRNLDISRCGIVDISMLKTLSNLQSLDLSLNPKLSDISALSKIPTLHTIILVCCHQLKDVSALINIPALHKLNIRYCNQLRDTSDLVQIPDLLL